MHSSVHPTPEPGTAETKRTPQSGCDSRSAPRRLRQELAPPVHRPPSNPSSIAATFGYDYAGRPASAAESALTSLTAHWTYRVDGLLGTRTWTGNNATATYSYDDAKRPTGLVVGGSGVAAMTMSQTYDRAGNVTSDARTFAGIGGNAGTGTQSFTYDGLGRVTEGALPGLTTDYPYDRDSNRTQMTINGVDTSSRARTRERPTTSPTTPGAT